MDNQNDTMIRRLGDYEKVSGYLWIGLGILQICTLIGAIAGIWNIYAGSTRIKMSKQIWARNPNVPKAFENNMGELIIIGLINLILGGVIGIIFVIFDFFIRDKVITNAHLFTGNAPVMAAPQAMRNVDFDQELRVLAKLKEDGVITAQEFDRKKGQILGL